MQAYNKFIKLLFIILLSLFINIIITLPVNAAVTGISDFDSIPYGNAYINNVTDANASITVHNPTNFYLHTASDGLPLIQTRNVTSDNVTWTNPYSIKFTNVGRDCETGEYLDLVIDCTWLQIVCSGTRTIDVMDFWHNPVTGKNEFGLSSGTMSTGGRVWQKIQGRIYYHNTSTLYTKEVQFAVEDIDIYSDTYPTWAETIVFKEGFTDKYYVSNVNTSGSNKYLDISDYSGRGKKVTAIKSAGDCQPENRVIAYIKNGTFAFEWWAYGAGTDFFISQYGLFNNISNPTKTTTTGTVKPGEKVSFDITQKLPYVDSENIPTSISLTDTLDKSIDMQGVNLKVYKSDGTDITSLWNTSISGSTVSFSAKNPSAVMGLNLKFHIESKLKTGFDFSSYPKANNCYQISNKATLKLDSKTLQTNEVKVQVPYYKITTEVENGVIDGSINEILVGSSKTINYHENDGYMIKSITVDGTPIDWTTHFNSYAFTNITSNHHIKVVYEKIPTTNLSVKKNWNDTNNNDGFRPTSMTVNFLKNNVSQETITLNAANNWSASKNNLRLYTPKRELIVYDWSENMNFTNNNKYKQTGKTTTNGITTFTNTHELEKVDSTVTKIWDDSNNNDGFRPNEVEMILYKNDIEYKRVKVKASEDWKYTEKNLLKYSPIGKVNTYYWREVETYSNHDKYEILETVQKGLNTEITNYHELEKVSSTITKIWDDENNNDGFRPNNIYAKLYQNDKVIKDKVILNDGNKFKQTEYNLLKYHDGGQEYIYHWEEDTTYDNADKYTSTKTQNGYDTTIINSHPLEKVEVNVQKIWEDNDNHDKVRPSSIQVNLLGNGKFVKQVQLSAINNWKTTITDLNKYEPYGKLIHYTFEEPVLYYDYESTVVTEGYNTVITNTRDLTKTSRTVKKEWNDNNNQDQMRPSSVEVELLANGEVIQTIHLSEANNWTEKISSLNYKDNEGEIISYTFKEKTIPQGYEASYDTTGKITTITNTYVSEKTRATVIKKWEDNNNQDGTRPDSVEMRLYANNKATKYKVTLNSRNEWTDGIANLDKYKDGEEIHYEFKEETQIKGYEAISEQNGNLTMITNIHRPEEITSEVEKLWNDEDDIYGIRPTSIEVNLLANDKVVQMITLTKANDWKAAIDNLPKFQNGEEIIYTWQEVEEPMGYLVTYKQDGNKTTITNSFEPYVHAPEEGLSVSIKKKWDDNNDSDKLRPNEIEVLLLANHRKIVKKIILSEDNDWSATVNNLNDANGLIEYTWEENGLPLGYYNEIKTKDNKTVITNIHEPDKTSVTLKKEWNDDNNRDGIRPKSIKVALLANEEQIQEIELTENDNWEKTITDLPLNNKDGLIEYTCKELSYSKDYSPSIEVNGALITITNTHNPEMTELKVTKEWKDNNNSDKKRPDEILVQLLGNDKLVKEIHLNSKNNWTQALTVPKNEDGKAIKYQFKEASTINGYKTTYKQKDNETVIINTYDSETVDLEVEKIWIDNNNKDGIRPSEVTVILIADGKPTDIKLTLNKDNNWYGIVENQLKYKDGKEIKYNFVLENEIDQYITTYEQEGYKTIITSEHESEEITLKVKQNWIDDNNKDGYRPNEVVVVLVIDGKPSDIKLTLNKDNNWYGELNQPKYKDGKEIKYNFVLENEINKYTTTYEQEGYTTIITSEYHPEKVRPEVQIIWDDLDNKFNKRPNEVIVRLYINGEASDIVITLNKDNNWYAQLEEMPRYKDGKEIEYKFVEDVPTGYKESYDYEGNKTIITNYLREDEPVITNPETTPKPQDLVEVKETSQSKEKVNLEDGKADKVRTEDTTIIYVFVVLFFISCSLLIYKHKKK